VQRLHGHTAIWGGHHLSGTRAPNGNVVL
jgi:hypothetical protein